MEQLNQDEAYIFYLKLVLQKNLLTILKLADFTVEDFANSLDVTDQTIRNICSFETRLTGMQFLSILTKIDLECTYGSKNKPDESFEPFLETLLNPSRYEQFLNLSKKLSEKKILSKNSKSKKNLAFMSGLLSMVVLGTTTAMMPFTAPVMLGALTAGALTTGKVIKNISDEEKSSEEEKICWQEIFHKTESSLVETKYYDGFKNSFKKTEKDKREALVDKYIEELISKFCKS